MRDTLRPGDVLLVEGNNHISGVIQNISPNPPGRIRRCTSADIHPENIGLKSVDAAEQPRWPASRPLRHPRVAIIRSCDGRKFDSLAIDFLLGKDFLAFSEP